MKKRFTFRFKLAYEITLDEDQIYPDYPWYLNPEHARAYERSQKSQKGQKKPLDAARVLKTVRAAGGPAAIYHDWNLEPGLFEAEEKFEVVGLKVVQSRPGRRKKS
jgi:hypothetical protein